MAVILQPTNITVGLGKTNFTLVVLFFTMYIIVLYSINHGIEYFYSLYKRVDLC